MPEEKKSVEEALEEEAQEEARPVLEKVKSLAGEVNVLVQKAKEAPKLAKQSLDQARQGLDKMATYVGELTGKAREEAKEIYSKAKEKVDQATSWAKEAYGVTREKVREMDLKGKGDQLINYIKENPGKSVVIALVVGFLVGYLTRPRE